ncbi:MAG: PKD domain-containing protein [Bacteroidota bacterium]
MKKIFGTFFLSILFFAGYSAHIKGGFFTYEYLGDVGANDASYKITLTMYMSCNPSEGQLTSEIEFSFFDGVTNNIVRREENITITGLGNLAKIGDDLCISNNQAICYYTIVDYSRTITLPKTTNGYIVSYQRCCRIGAMENLVNSGSVGNTYSIRIPGTSSPVPDAVKNSSPIFPRNDTAVVCSGSYFSFPFSASDKDPQDKLTYTFCSAISGGSVANAAPIPADAPPYANVPYNAPYNATQPMGPAVTIDPNTGLISGIAPTISQFSNGEFVISVCVTETRNGIYVGESRKELHIQVQDCVPVQAKLAPKGVTCDGFSVDFSNSVPLAAGTLYSWNFGDAASGANNTASSATATHIYTDTGVYKVVLQVAIGGFCSSKDSIMVKVYPGFFPDFSPVAPFCEGQPLQFTDNTTSTFGSPTGWRWKFGDPSAGNDSSALKNPSHTYSKAGTYDVRFIVGNTLGCVDTVLKQVTILAKPAIGMLSRDTTYCGLDTLMLAATGTGTFSWSPSVNILNSNTATPLVFPTTPTLYKVTLNQDGCTNQDSVRVTPTNNLTNSITASTANICEGDSLTLTANSNYTSGLSWSWSPAGFVADPSVQVAKAFPPTTTTFTLTTRFGKNCIATNTQTITVKALAIASAGPDQAICEGQANAQLAASGGTTYQWSPMAGLSNPNIPNPLASPTITTKYVVAVGIPGCSQTRRDTVEVLVRTLPPINVTNDTLICTIDTLQLIGSGTGSFVWTPNFSISNTTSAQPLVSPDVPTKYFAELTDPFGCKNRNSVFVNVTSSVSINAGNDTTICTTDAIRINTVSNALSFQWSPSNYLDSINAKRPLATPLDPSVTYTVVGRIGKCVGSDNITITTVPYPQLTVTPDTLICFGDSAPLFAAGGTNYSWTPANFLSSVAIPNPISVKPTADIKYTVSVTNPGGCPKPSLADVWVRVYPRIVADAGPSDTSITLGQPLQLNGTGSTNYSWTPSTWLSNPGIANPVASPEDDIVYRLTVSNNSGCSGTDSIAIKVFKVAPSFYVPTGFSPNNDGRNDVIKPILLGMRSLKHFRVFNRWGQVLFQTAEKGKGWDGTFKGNPQDPGTYVWMAEGETFAGKVIKQQGTVILLR